MPTYYYDDLPRIDRISTRARSVRDAANILIKKYTVSSPRNSQKLFLQVFQKHYRNRPNICDWIRFWMGGMAPWYAATITCDFEEWGKELNGHMRANEWPRADGL